jgi:hypothetical protein
LAILFGYWLFYYYNNSQENKKPKDTLQNIMEENIGATKPMIDSLNRKDTNKKTISPKDINDKKVPKPSK